MPDLASDSQGLHVLGVSGSLHENSRSALVLELFLRHAAERGAQRASSICVPWNSHCIAPIASLPPRPKTYICGHALGGVRGTSLPDYHGSMSGAFVKNFLDYNWEECAGKLFGYICSSHEKGLTVMDQMRTVVRQCYGWSLPYGLSFHGSSDLDAAGAIVNARIDARLRMMARDLVTYGTLLHRQFGADFAGAETNTFAAAYRE